MNNRRMHNSIKLKNKKFKKYNIYMFLLKSNYDVGS